MGLSSRLLALPKPSLSLSQTFAVAPATKPYVMSALVSHGTGEDACWEHLQRSSQQISWRQPRSQSTGFGDVSVNSMCRTQIDWTIGETHVIELLNTR